MISPSMLYNVAANAVCYRKARYYSAQDYHTGATAKIKFSKSLGLVTVPHLVAENSNLSYLSH